MKKNISNQSLSHSVPQHEIENTLEVNTESGLSLDEAALRLQFYGKNSIVQEKGKSPWIIFLEQFKSPIVYLLIFAVAISFFFKEWLDAIAILIVIFINAFIGFYMEYQADRSMEMLKKLSSIPARVLREGKMRNINSEDVVPGDIVFVEAGDLVPADLRIIKNSQLLADESSLTGESIPVDKTKGQLPENTALAERSNMLYKGTSITKGNACAIVVGTNMNTELGNIAKLVQSADQSITPLEKKLEEFSKKLIKITAVLVFLLFMLGLINGQNWLDMLKASIALAVAAIPEGLPIIATLALAQGMLRMAKHQVIVKKLSSVETLGGTNVICTDKTGTLTQNKIEVSTVITATGKVEADEFNPDKMDATQDILLRISTLCNTAEISLEGKEFGDPLETGLLKFVMQQNISIEQLRKQFPVEKEEPFSSETKVMAMLCRTENGYTVYAKGANEEIIKRSTLFFDGINEIPFDEKRKQVWLNQADNMATSGLRVIAGAYKNASKNEEQLSNNLVYIGLFGLLDPPAEGVFEAIKECKSAGINVIMITGDHPSTAKNIATKLGIIADQNQAAILGNEMSDYAHLTNNEKESWVKSNVFARVSPKQKLDLVTVLQDRKYIVAMTGDGVNDAPALKKADIGIAMGIRGSQVAQEVADMVLKDDSFSSIVLAIKQGRIIFENIRKFVVYLLSCNLSELMIISFIAIFNFHFQLFPLQLLYMNIVTDVLQALALGVSEGSDIVMLKPPRNLEDPILDKKRIRSVFFYSTILSMASLGAVYISHHVLHEREHWNNDLCNNILFFTLICSQLLHVFNMGSPSLSLFENEIVKNKYVWLATFVCIGILTLTYLTEPIRRVLHIQFMSAADWGVVFVMSFLSLLFIQLSHKLKLIKP